MDAVIVAWRSLVAAHKFFFWALVEAATRAIYWHKEASRELVILNPAKPKDLYDNGYALFAYDINNDGWTGTWRRPDAKPGEPSDERFHLLDSQWGYVPFHEVSFSDMPHISYGVRAVSLEWCRKQGIQFESMKAAA